MSIETPIHHVTYDHETHAITFTCSGDETAECHNYPTCGCETWESEGHEHPFVPQEKCWMAAGWFDPNVASYEGNDETDCPDHGFCPAKSGSGFVDAWFDGEQLIWSWKAEAKA